MQTRECSLRISCCSRISSKDECTPFKAYQPGLTHGDVLPKNWLDYSWFYWSYTPVLYLLDWAYVWIFQRRNDQRRNTWISRNFSHYYGLSRPHALGDSLPQSCQFDKRQLIGGTPNQQSLPWCCALARKCLVWHVELYRACYPYVCRVQNHWIRHWPKIWLIDSIMLYVLVRPCTRIFQRMETSSTNALVSTVNGMWTFRLNKSYDDQIFRAI